jgi:hypothetical protein
MRTTIIPTIGNKFLWTITPKSSHPSMAAVPNYGTATSQPGAVLAANSYVNAVVQAKLMSLPQRENHT